MDGSQVRFIFHYTRSFILTSPFPPSVSQESKQQILQPLSVLRPKFRVNEHFNNIATSIYLCTHLQAIAQSLRDLVWSSFLQVSSFWYPSLHRTLSSLKKNLIACYWIMIVYFQQWAFQLVFGDELEKSTKGIVSSQSLLVLKGTCCEK